MKKSTTLIFALAATALSRADNADLMSLAQKLDALSPYSAHVTYSVLLPSASDDIVYDIDLWSRQNADDELGCNDYLIEWSLPTPSGKSAGFNAYSAGNHFRYRDNRLQEYHYEWDSLPFITAGGVHRAAQFADLLPQSLASMLRDMASDQERYKIVTKNSPNIISIKGTETRHGITAREITMTFDATTSSPISIDYENNPGAISEQTVTIKYHPATAPSPAGYDEQNLIALYPDVFERFRQSNYRVENLGGTPLPQFSLPTLSGQRFTHHRGEELQFPTIIAVIDPSTVNAVETIAALRQAVDCLPMTLSVILAFTSNDTDSITALTSPQRPEETIVTSARSLARDLGITAMPVLVFANRDATISDTQIGFNKALAEIVIEKAALMQ